MEQEDETHQNLATPGLVGKPGRHQHSGTKGFQHNSCTGKEEKQDHPKLVVPHGPFSGCDPPKHLGICLTSAFKKVSGAKNMIKSNMCLRAFLDQGPVTSSLPAGSAVLRGQLPLLPRAGPSSSLSLLIAASNQAKQIPQSTHS